MDDTELCAICHRMCLEHLASGRGVLHRHIFYFIELSKDDTKREISCNLCKLIWWSLRHDHSWLEEIAATGEVRLWHKPSREWPIGREGYIDLLEVVAASASDFEDMIWIDSDGLQVHHSKKVARGELVAYGIRGMPARSGVGINGMVHVYFGLNDSRLA